MIDPEIEQAGMELMVGARKALDEILLKGGMTQEEIQKVVEEAMDGVRIDGVPLRAIPCQHCEGRGWIVPERKTEGVRYENGCEWWIEGEPTC